MDWDSITQTGARASGVEESTPRMAVCCKSRVLPQHAQPVAQILNQVLNPVYFARIAAFLFGLLDSVQVETSAPPRFLGCHPFSHVFLGFSFEEARRRACLDLDGIEQTKEKCRDTRKVNWIQDLIKDLRYGLRMLRQNPGFTADCHSRS